MPRRTDLRSILLLGSGPIVIGQACEFDYSGVQALKALREEGYRTILLNSNPATIMTDAEWADRTYIEPITVEAAERILAAERPDAILPTMGGQTALNLAVSLAKEGILAKYGTQLIGAQLDAITVAPAQTLSDVEYQAMRDMARQVIRAIGVETGGSNIQFGVHPQTGRIVVIEMNPRVSRSSALASKATGFPIAKIAAKLAVGYTLDEITNDITKTTPSSFEPAIDYCVVKIPRFNFEKFPHADQTLTTSMKSVGEVMSIGRTFAIALQKALRSMENRTDGLDSPLQRDGVRVSYSAEELEQIRKEVKTATPRRLFWLAEACRAGISAEEIHGLSAIDPWFIREVQALVDAEREIADSGRKTGPRAQIPDLVRW